MPRVRALLAASLLLVAAPAGAGPAEDFAAAVTLAEEGKYEEAASRFRLLAQQGHAGSQYNLGVLYDLGRGLPQDHFAAFNWYALAAERGLAQAEYNIGVMYYLGRGVEKDLAKAAKWYRRAAEGGLAEAQTNLAYLLESGQGVAQDHEEAVAWYAKAAEQGSEKAQFNLAYLHAKGLGTERDLVAAYKWFTLAGLRGHMEAARNRALIASAMTTDQLTAGDRAVRGWLAAHRAFVEALRRTAPGDPGGQSDVASAKVGNAPPPPPSSAGRGEEPPVERGEQGGEDVGRDLPDREIQQDIEIR